MDKNDAENPVKSYYHYLCSKSKTMNKKSAFTAVKDLPKKMVS
jgi:hypothetical protein